MFSVRNISTIFYVSSVRSLVFARALSSSSNMAVQLKHVPGSKLYVSEPDPRLFGNPSNEESNIYWDNDSKNWLKSRFHFSFAEYNNYKNSKFGVLRVMNDDLVQPDRGFGTHGHANMEIVTYIVQGSLTHQDSMGAVETLGRGSVQFMSANSAKDKGLRFIQTWIVPRKSGLVPNYGSFDPAGDNARDICTENNQWRHLVSDVKDGPNVAPVQIEQDANLYVAELDTGKSLDLQLKKDRMAYVLCVEGSVKISDGSGNGATLHRHDGCEVKSGGSEGTLAFETNGSEIGAHVLVYEMALDNSGRKDF